MLYVDSPSPPWSDWKASDAVMHGKVGLTLAQFDWVYKRCRPALIPYRLSLKQHNPNIPIMSPHNLLCIAIHWLRRGHTWREMELDFDRPHQWLNTMVHRVVPIIERSIFNELIRPIDSTSPASSMSTLFDCYMIVDSTPIPLPKTPFLRTHYPLQLLFMHFHPAAYL